MADDQASSSQHDEEEETKRYEIGNLVQTIETMYEVLNMPICKVMQIHGPQRFDIDSTAKSIEEANEFKIVGDQNFAAGQHKAALRAYTKCLALVEEDSEKAASVYANRSAALFKLGKYEASLLDIDRALNGKYPVDKKRKLRVRKERCLSMTIHSHRVSEAERLPRQMESLQVALSEASSSDDVEVEWRNLCRFANPLLPNTSAKVKLAYDEKWGRHMVASEDIQPGEVLSCEKFFSLMVEPELTYERCSCCLSNCYTLIPCPSCNQAMYCSEDCRTRAYNLYHRIECQVYKSVGVLEDLDEDDRMALRMLLIGTEQGAGLNTLMQKLSVPDILEENVDPTNKPFAIDYLGTLKLRRVFRKPLVVDFISKPGPIAKTIIALQDAGYFESDPEQLPREEHRRRKRFTAAELFTAILLFNHMASVKASKLPMEEFLSEDSDEGREIGSGVCILHSMINHSCDPNTSSMVRNQEHVLFAVRSISKGEQIFISYIDTFVATPLEERVSKLFDPLGNYQFFCECRACTNKWPIYLILQEERANFLTENVKDAMADFNGIVYPIVEDGINAFSQGEILQIIYQLRNWLHLNIEEPCITIADCESLLIRCMKYFYGTLLPDRMTETSKRENIERLLKHLVIYPLQEMSSQESRSFTKRYIEHELLAVEEKC